MLKLIAVFFLLTTSTLFAAEEGDYSKSAGRADDISRSGDIPRSMDTIGSKINKAQKENKNLNMVSPESSDKDHWGGKAKGEGEGGGGCGGRLC